MQVVKASGRVGLEPYTRSVQPVVDMTPTHLPSTLDVTPAKRRLYEAAVELFGTRGYHGVSVRDLADVLGIKAPSLYAHVANKQQLLFELALIGQQEYLGRMRAALLNSGSEPRGQVRGIVRAHVLAHLQLPLLARVSSVEIRHLDEARLAEVLALRGEAGRIFLDVIARGQSLCAFTVSNPLRATRAIADMGIRMAEWTPPAATEEHETLADDYADIALRILG